MSGQAGTIRESEFYALDLRDGVRVSLAPPPGEDPSKYIRDWFERASRPYERWASAALGPLDELFAELVADGRLPVVPYRAAPQAPIWGEDLLLTGTGPAREAHFDPPRLLRLALHQEPLEETYLLLALTRPIPRADWEELAKRVRPVLAATKPAEHAHEAPRRAEAVPPVEDKTRPGLGERLNLRQRTQPRLALEVQVTPERLPLGELADVTFSISFRNEGDAPAEVFPALAQLQARSGWGGPTWTLAASAAGFPPERIKLVELRTWYGPPGIPPTGNVFAPYSRAVKPGAVETHSLTACWIPRSRLPEESVRPAVLDPEGMDGVAGWPYLGRSSVFVLGQTRAAVQAALDKSPDFLRGHVVLFCPPRGLLRVTLGYYQQPWVSFAPRQTWRLAAPPLNLLSERDGS